MFESPLAFEVLEVTLCFREPGREVWGWTRALGVNLGQEHSRNPDWRLPGGEICLDKSPGSARLFQDEILPGNFHVIQVRE